ncbi:hypothetical protein L3X38_027346 [Prunus dulcis]|uniref:tRNA/rRNA methyltransferase SpoU type domain-containing protein n=1 Tax=Prunus dulcis TaxID=3755 RepID=A0AAD4VMQ2_PRUDU|nr:hypothetical protein L3X38_027346 [Prunus dulcis]
MIHTRILVLVLGLENEGVLVDIIHVLDACLEIPQLGVVRSLNVHVSGAIALWEYTRQQRSQKNSEAVVSLSTKNVVHGKKKGIQRRKGGTN